MTRVAIAEVAGPEAKGPAIINELDDGSYELLLSDFWVAPGAPDVWVAISPETDGQPKESTIDLASYNYNQSTNRIFLKDEIDLQTMKTIIIYCKRFNVHFGHGLLSFEN